MEAPCSSELTSGTCAGIRTVSCRRMIKKSGPSLWVRSSSISHGKDSIGKVTSRHPFTCKIQLLLPSQNQAAVPPVPDISAFYYSVQAGSALFTDEEFISTNIASADFQCISLGHVYEVAVTPDKHMHLVLPKDQYQAAGLQASGIPETGVDDGHSSSTLVA